MNRRTLLAVLAAWHAFLALWGVKITIQAAALEFWWMAALTFALTAYTAAAGTYFIRRYIITGETA